MTYHPKSDFMDVMIQRGFLADCTDYQGLDEALIKGVVPAYIGYDATAASLHVGHLLNIMMLRWLQKTGHQPITLMGGGTTKVGDPSFRSDERPLLGPEQIDANIAGMNRVFDRYLDYNDTENGEELWGITKGIVWIVSNHWKEADKGIWEFRSEDRHFTFSKVLCWVAIDRAIKVARLFKKSRKLEKWTALEQEIKQDILDNAWNPDVNAFTQSYGSPDMDASVLLMESYGFIHAKDPKFVSTVKAIEKELSNDGLLYRYKNEDDFGLPSSSFTICTFWFINSLFKIGEEEKAMKHFDKLLTYSNHLGLFSEDIDFKTKRLLGNFPQAYSHLALIECAINFSKKESEEQVLESIS